MATNYYQDYDSIVLSLKKYMPDDMDTREGTPLQMMISATAVQLAMYSAYMDAMFENAFADTAAGEYLDNIVSILGISRRGKTKAVVKIESDAPLAAGTVFTGGDYEYVITEAKNGYYIAECQTAGTAPNSYMGEVLPKETIEGASSIAITGIIGEGKDEEDDDSLRERFFNRARFPVCAGNMNYYREVLSEMPGVGGAKIVPAHEGGGTVKIVVMGNNMGVPSEETLRFVKEKIDPEDKSGLGYGIAPIGHRVTVEAAEPVDINVKVKLTTKYNITPGAILMMSRSELRNMVRKLNETWSASDNIILRDSFFESYFLKNANVKDVEVMSINGEANRLILNENQITGGFSISE